MFQSNQPPNKSLDTAFFGRIKDVIIQLVTKVMVASISMVKIGDAFSNSFDSFAPVVV